MVREPVLIRSLIHVVKRKSELDSSGLLFSLFRLFLASFFTEVFFRVVLLVNS